MILAAATVASAVLALVGTFQWRTLFTGDEWVSFHCEYLGKKKQAIFLMRICSGRHVNSCCS
jgi:hypothetical protein